MNARRWILRRWSLLTALGVVASALVAVSASGKSPVRYSHTQHQSAGVDQADCRQCHTLEDDLSAAPPGKNHQPCSDGKCHATEFFAREPTICVVCHEGSQPWVKQKARLRRRKASEFTSDLSHKAHTKALGSGAGNDTCKKCHGDPYKDKAGGRGHATCAPCHGKSAEPAMGNCGDCHALGDAVERKATSEWSVAKLYDHKDHGKDLTKRGAETACQSCHEGVATADSLAAIVAPTMTSCDRCHNGKVAFKTTGFGCYRCHSREEGSAK